MIWMYTDFVARVGRSDRSQGRGLVGLLEEINSMLEQVGYRDVGKEGRITF